MTVEVLVVEFGDRSAYQLRWRDPLTGKLKHQSSGVERGGKQARRRAEAVAAEKAASINRGEASIPGRLSFDEFEHRYLEQHVSGLAKATREKIDVVFGHVRAEVSPRYLVDLDEQRLSTFAAALRKKGRAEATISNYLGQLKAALRWAVDQKLLRVCPKIPRIQRKRKSKGTSPAKGRPLTLEELERMLDSVDKVVAADADAWRFFLRGLWASGLRLTEATELYWDRSDKLRPVLSGKYPLLQIPGELEKGNTDRLLPIAPEFAVLLQSIPERERRGRVFRLNSVIDGEAPVRADWIGKTLSRIGKQARVIVSPESGSQKIKYASAHDLRRSFGNRWAQRLMPAELKELMRHASIETTLRYYVGLNAEETAAKCWRVFEAEARATPEAQGRLPRKPQAK